jgi:glycosyltransferase involved in cell wall biosynthesis
VQRALRRRLPGWDPRAHLVRACRTRGVSLVHSHFGTDSLPALELASALGVPLAVTYHGFDATLTEEAMRADGGFAEYLERRDELFERADAILAVSQFIADELERQGAPRRKLKVHHLGGPPGSAPAGEPPPPVVLFIGRHVEKKGIGDLIEAMGRVRGAVPDARLLVVGDGPLRAGLEARARELGVDADFAGWLEPHAVAEHLRRVRVLCVPSRRAANGDAEGLPTVIPEAAAQGLPVVGTRHSGIPEAIGEERGGLLADEGDVDGIARQLIAVLSEDELWRRLSAGAVANAARNFDPQRQADELERIYDELLAA